MLPLLTDENFDGRIIRGLHAREPTLDLLRVDEADLLGAIDLVVLEWASTHDRVVVTHDTQTMLGHAYDRVKRGQKMPGLIHVPDWVRIGQAIDEVLLIAIVMGREEIDRRVIYIPLK